MRTEYAMAVPQPRRRKRRQTRRCVWALLPAVAVLLAAVMQSAPTVRNEPLEGEAAQQHHPVEIIYQNPELPNGCEVTSLTMVLASLGHPVDKLTLYRDYLPKGDFSYAEGQCFGPDPERWYVGNASEQKGGWYCFENPIVEAANRWLEYQQSSLCANSVSGLSRIELDRYAQDNVPLIVWVTLDYAAPRQSNFTWLFKDGTVYQPYSNLHCVVLAGMQNGQYQIADPIDGFVTVSKDTFWSSFSAMGCRAVIIQ